MAKSKNKSSILRSVQRDFRLHASRQTFASRMPRAQSHSRSPVLQDLMSPSDQAFTPPGTRVVFTDLAGSPREARVSSKRRNRPCRRTVLLRNHLLLLLLVNEMIAPLVVPDPASCPGNIRAGLTPVAPTLVLARDKTPSGSRRYATIDTPTSTPNTKSPALIHFPKYASSETCHLKETNIEELIDM